MKVIIIGGSATGMGVTAQLLRSDLNAKISVYQKSSYISLGACGLPYFVGKNFDNENNMIARTPEFFRDKGVELNLEMPVTDIDFKNKTISFQKVNGQTGTDTYDKLVIATGAHPIIPDFAKQNAKNVFTLTTLEDGRAILAQITNNKEVKHVTIIGGGFIGLETAEALAENGKKIAIVEMQNHVMQKQYDDDFLDNIEATLKKHNIELLTNEKVVKFTQTEENVSTVHLESDKIIETDAVILALGFKPATEFLKDSELQMLANGAIKVDLQGRTNIVDVYSGGDCATSRHLVTGEDIYSPLATVASKFAKVIAQNIAGVKKEFYGSLQTSIIRVFELECARTGLTVSAAKAQGINVKEVTIKDKDHTDYVAGQSELVLKLVYDIDHNVLVGAQLQGQNKAVLRIYGLIDMIWNKTPIDEKLQQIDLPYAPPFGRTVDIIHIALSKLLK